MELNSTRPFWIVALAVIGCVSSLWVETAAAGKPAGREMPICTSVAKSIYDDRDTMLAVTKQLAGTLRELKRIQAQLDRLYMTPASEQQEAELIEVQATREKVTDKSRNQWNEFSRLVREVTRDIKWGVRNGCLREESRGSISFRLQNRLWWRDLERATRLLHKAHDS